MLNLSSLNPQQRQAVETVKGPVLILAGAGTGKTRVITFRIAHLIDKGVPPGKHSRRYLHQQGRPRDAGTHQQIDFLRRRNSPPIPADAQPIRVRRFARFIRFASAFCAGTSSGSATNSNFVIYDESEQLGVVKKILAQISAKGEKTDPAAVLSLLSRFKNGGENAAVFADESVRALAQHIRSRYESALRACNAVDFDDLILLTLKLFAEHPDALESCRAKYRYVMADEYQDTNAAQFQTHPRAHGRNIGIFAWSATTTRASTAGAARKSAICSTWKNIFRKSKSSSSNKIIAPPTPFSTPPTPSSKTIRAAAPNSFGRAKGRGAKSVLRAYANDDDEARNVVEQIEFARLANRVPWSDNAILFRTNAQSRPLETALRQANVRYHLIGGQSFFDRREVKDFIAYLKMFLQPAR